MHLRSDLDSPAEPTITFEDFLAVDIRVGRILTAQPAQGTSKPTCRMTIDFGPVIGIKKSLAQITENYAPESLVGRMVIAVVNFPPRQIGKSVSEVLTLGFPDETGAVVLVAPDRAVSPGSRLF